jgi:hypothetical protein
LHGSGIGSIPRHGLISAIRSVLLAVVPGKMQIETQVVPLSEVEEKWNKDSDKSRSGHSELARHPFRPLQQPQSRPRRWVQKKCARFTTVRKCNTLDALI